MFIDTPERVWHFTSTGWTAIGSIVASVSVGALVVFNWKYLRLTHKLSDSTAIQAAAAQQSLKRLEEQISADLVTRRHMALAVLRETQTRIRYWITCSRSELRSEQQPPLQLRPDDWNMLVAYTSHHLPEAYSHVAKVSQGLHLLELELNRLVIIPLRDRGPGSSLRARIDGFEKNMDDMHELLVEAHATFKAAVSEDGNTERRELAHS